MSDNISRQELIDAVTSGKPRPYQETGSAQHNYDSGNGPTDDKMTTAEMTAQYTVHAFGAPLVDVTRKSDGVRGTLEFSHSPRYYWGFRPR